MKEMATKVVKAIPKTPVTVKMRSGWDKENIIISELEIAFILLFEMYNSSYFFHLFIGSRFLLVR